MSSSKPRGSANPLAHSVPGSSISTCAVNSVAPSLSDSGSLTVESDGATMKVAGVVNRLLYRVKYVRAVRPSGVSGSTSANAAGIPPVSWLSFRNKAYRFDRLPSSGGISPVSSLLSRDNSSSSERLPSSRGMLPLNWLLFRYKTHRLDRLPNSSGIGTLSLLSFRYNQARFDRPPSCSGISPVRSL